MLFFIYEYNFRSVDRGVMMNDEIYMTLKKFEDLDTNDYLILSKIQIEIGKFCRNSLNISHNKFQL
jgi:hypothetical protein